MVRPAQEPLHLTGPVFLFDFDRRLQKTIPNPYQGSYFISEKMTGKLNLKPPVLTPEALQNRGLRGSQPVGRVLPHRYPENGGSRPALRGRMT